MRIDDLQLFVTAADTGSFSEAARRLNLSPVVASAIIKRLETRVGARLFERSTRHVRLSNEGERLLPFARDALSALSQGKEAIHGEAAETGLGGPLRLSLPSDLGRNHIVGWIEDFIAQNPSDERISLDLRVSDRLSHLLQSPIDFVLRYGVLEDSELVALPIAPENRRILCASPEYLKRRGMPSKLTDLAKHNCLRFMLGDQVHSQWHFTDARTKLVIEVQGDRVSDDAGVVRQWALAGCGIAYKSQLDVAADLTEGHLIQILPALKGEPAPLYLLAVSRHRITRSIRLLSQFLATQCQILVR